MKGLFFFKIIEVSIYRVKKQVAHLFGGHSVKRSEIPQNGIQNQKNGDKNYHLIGLANIPADTEPSWVSNVTIKPLVGDNLPVKSARAKAHWRTKWPEEKWYR